MKKVVKCLTFLSLFLGSVCSIAATVGQGKIVAVQAGSHMSIPYVIVSFDPAPILTSTCATSGESRLIFDGGTPAGQIMTSLVLTAKSTGQVVEYRGYGNCFTDAGLNWTWEKVDWVRLK